MRPKLPVVRLPAVGESDGHPLRQTGRVDDDEVQSKLSLLDHHRLCSGKVCNLTHHIDRQVSSFVRTGVF
jgi:hypothetical protein